MPGLGGVSGHSYGALSLASAIPNSSTVASLLNSVHLAGFGVSQAKRNPDLINRLFDELLREVFLWLTYPTASGDDYQDRTRKFTQTTPVFSDSLRGTPFPLTQVCRRWRSVAADHRALWRSICIERPSRKHLHRVKLWMSYVRHYPLEVTFVEYTDLPEEDQEAALELWNLVSQRFHRWLTLDVILGRRTTVLLAERLEKLKQFRAPVLENVSIRILEKVDQVQNRKEQVVDGIWTAVQTIPNIWALRWNYADWTYTPPHRFSWQLLVLNIETNVSIAWLVKHLHAYIKLEELVVVISAPSPDDDPSWTSVNNVFMPCLQSLQIKSPPGPQTPGSLAALFHRYCFPRLKTLEIDGIPADECTALWNSLTKSKCNLDLLVISSPDLRVVELKEWFDFPFLRALHTLMVDGVEVTNEVLGLLSCPAVHVGEDMDRQKGGTVYFENLQHLQLSTGLNVDAGVLLRMLGSRYWTVPVSPGSIPSNPKPSANIDCDMDLDMDIDPIPTFTSPSSKKKTELISAVFGVHEKTYPMQMYERMINDCAARIKEGGWEKKRLTFEVR
ncbi:hypothetical protein GALMADRAFT_270781 [Galerina marginata CBS 339.88]|uniref:F-box domain-containing protein n=1 Tax=Galerina marginata (strain CBS 339.88) TaxID=685588 RepID=A0A067SQL2_GALM3|nr:hypothetical protein GALMADRAFT_270781 [Galerina marginata CBS 339.88]